VLDQTCNALWTDFQIQTGADPHLERVTFRRWMCRRSFTHLFPPPILDPIQFESLERDTLQILKIIRSIPERFYGGDIQRWLDFLLIRGDEAALLLRLQTPRFQMMATQFVRPDFILTVDGPKLVEMNVSTPIGGMHTSGPYQEAFARSEYSKYLARLGIKLESPDLAAIWTKAFQDVARKCAGNRAPVLFAATANPTDRFTGRQTFMNMASNAGFAVLSGPFRELEIDDSGVSIEGERIDAIFTMFTWSELRRHVPLNLVSQLAELDEKGLVDFIAPPGSALFDNKANLELLSSNIYDSNFTSDERGLLDKYIPRTFRLDVGSRSRALASQDALVLKPTSECAGRGVIVGRHCNRDTWLNAIEAASQSKQLHVCQETIPPLLPITVTDGAQSNAYFMSLGPMVFGSRHAGTYVRQAPDRGIIPILNQSVGAEAGIAFVKADTPSLSHQSHQS